MFSFSLLGIVIYTFLILSIGAGLGIIVMCLLVGSK